MDGLKIGDLKPNSPRTVNRRFYLAGTFKEQEALLDWAKHVERLSGWTCTSRWLHERVENVDELVLANAAVECRDDLDRADVLVINAKDSSTGGLWWEFGYAVGTAKPVLVWASPECGNPFPRLDLDPTANVTWMDVNRGVSSTGQRVAALDPKWTAEQTAMSLDIIERQHSHPDPDVDRHDHMPDEVSFAP